MDEAIAVLRRAAAIDLNDYLRFDFLDGKQPAPGASGRKVRFNAYKRLVIGDLANGAGETLAAAHASILMKQSDGEAT